MNGETKRLYEYMVQTYAWVVAVRTYEWNYSATWRKEMLPGPYPPQLYNLKDDPEELRNVVDKYPDAGRMMAAKLNDYIGQGESLTRGSFHEQPSFDIGEVYVKSSPVRRRIRIHLLHTVIFAAFGLVRCRPFSGGPGFGDIGRSNPPFASHCLWIR